MASYPAIVIGAGPGGLSAANELTRRQVRCLVLEKGRQVGGLSRTETHLGYRFDVGGHRFYTSNEVVTHLWDEMLGGDLLTVPRISHICYRGRFFDYPLNLFNLLGNLGMLESARMLLSYMRAKILPHREERTFAQWVTNRFGYRLYREFFEAYTQKVWGIPCDQLSSDWAAQRIRGMSMIRAIGNALFGAGRQRTLAHEFRYPVLGVGMMWERFATRFTEQGGDLRLGHEVVGLRHEGDRVRLALVRNGDGTSEVEGDQFISSMPLSELIAKLSPTPPAEVVHAATDLKFRSFIQVCLIVNRPSLFADHWLYVHEPALQVGRIQNYGNWSAKMVADPATTCLGMEYFCTEGDDLWCMPDQDLMELASRELAALGLAQAAEVQGGAVIREPKAYPVYDQAYRQNVDTIRRYLSGLANLQTIGRGGMHRYNNMDHSMLSGILAAGNLLGRQNDVWSVNTDPSYAEGSVRSAGQ